MKKISFKEQLNRFAFEIGSLIFEARLKAGLTQSELAHKMKTRQPSIARAERGTSLPSLLFLFRLAFVLGTTLIPPKFAFIVDDQEATTGTSSVNLLAQNLGEKNIKLDIPNYSVTYSQRYSMRGIEENNLTAYATPSPHIWK